jgi:hypothetical protein
MTVHSSHSDVYTRLGSLKGELEDKVKSQMSYGLNDRLYNILVQTEYPLFLTRLIIRGTLELKHKFINETPTTRILSYTSSQT